MVDFALIATLVVSALDLVVNIVVPFSTGNLDLQICGPIFRVHHESVRHTESLPIGSGGEGEDDVTPEE